MNKFLLYENVKVKDEFLSEQVQGQVTLTFFLSLDGEHQVSVEGGDFFLFSDLLEFHVLDSI